MKKILSIIKNPIVKFCTAFIIVAFIGYKCGYTSQSTEIERKNIIKNGSVIVSIFKEDVIGYHIWALDKIETTHQADLLRSELGLYEDKKIYLYSDSTLDKDHYYASCLSILINNPRQSFDGKSRGLTYIESADTIKLMPYDDNGSICNVHTSRKVYSRDMELMDRAIRSLKIEFGNIIFLFTGGNSGEDYYATYTKSSISQRETEEQAVKNQIFELESSMSISDIGNIISFYAKIEQAKKRILSTQDKDARSNIEVALLRFQKKHFPMARRAYYNNAKNELWEKDIDVSMSGRDITFTGYMFVANRVKNDTFLEIKDELIKLRFKSVGFKAYDGDGREYWDLNSKGDSDI